MFMSSSRNWFTLLYQNSVTDVFAGFRPPCWCPSRERIPESWDLESTDKDLESSTEYLELGNPEYKTALDPLPNGINRMSYQP